MCDINTPLKDKVVLVTGATGGIGAAICRQAAHLGAQVVLAYRSQPQKAQALLDELSKISKTQPTQMQNLQEATPAPTNSTQTAPTPTNSTQTVPSTESTAQKATQHIMLHLDVLDGESIKAGLKKIIDTYARIDGLVNNAGLTKDNLLLRMNEDDFMAPINTNLKGAFLCSKAVLRPMLKARSGSIVNISSIIGHRGNAGQANYAASKAGLEAFTKSLAQEVGPRHIRVNTVAPGFIDTPMTQALPDEVKQNYLKAIPLGRFATPDEVAQSVCFLLGSQASYITGSCLHVNGGLF